MKRGKAFLKFAKFVWTKNYFITRPRTFMQIRIFENIIGKVEPRQKIVSHTERYKSHYISGVICIFLCVLCDFTFSRLL